LGLAKLQTVLEFARLLRKSLKFNYLGKNEAIRIDSIFAEREEIGPPINGLAVLF
jgi:hypothetical protein